MQLAALHVANLTDARYFSAFGVSWMGFSLDAAGLDHVPTDKLKEIRSWLEGPAVFGELGAQTPEEAARLASECSLDGLLAGMFHDVEALSKIPGARIFQELVVDPSTRPGELTGLARASAPFVEAFVLDLCKNPLAAERLLDGDLPILEDLRALCREHRVWLHAEVPAPLLAAVAESLVPHGLCIRGGSEIRPGAKVFDELDEWMETAIEL
jgi:phosphoribosylanthranilate isomerase